MARPLDESRKEKILLTAKSLFAKQGYEETSIQDIVKETGFPAGSIYTYFEGKEAIVKKILDDGFNEFNNRIASYFIDANTPNEKINILIDKALPGLFADIELITLLLTEAAHFESFDEKLNSLVDMLYELLNAAQKKDLDREVVKTGLLVILLGAFHSIRMVNKNAVKITQESVIQFVHNITRATLV